MKKLNLIFTPNKVKVGGETPAIEPNIKEDCIFYMDGKAIGFYMKRMPDNMVKIAEACNIELRSANVPKSLMQRPKMRGFTEDGRSIIDRGVKQYSTILGAIPPKPHMRRPYPSISSVHQHKKAERFIRFMLLMVQESEKLIQEILPEQYEEQKKLFEKVPDKWKFGKLYTSSISNYNISAPYHKDTGNMQNTVNVIITKREHSKGGNLNVPDYGITVDQCDNSILVYPAWKNIHGVTPIEPTALNGYRNSLVFYPLKAFLDNE